MVKKLLSVPALVLAVAVLAGCGGTPVQKSSEVAANKAPPPGCVDSTGTRLPLDQSHCVGFGRSWTQGDLRSTGYMDVGQALQTLDPSVQYRGP